MENPKKRTGRPAKKAKAGTRVSLGLKVTPSIKSSLDKAARESGRTQSQEAELRIERSFWADSVLNEGLSNLYGPKVAGILRLLGQVMVEAGEDAGFQASYTIEGSRSWLDIPYAYDQANHAAICVLKAFAPPGDIVEPDVPHGAILGKAIAEGILDKIEGRQETDEARQLSDEIRPLLGSLFSRLVIPKDKDTDGNGS